MAPADDPLDYQWAKDYQEYPMAYLRKAYDSKAYESIFGFEKPTLEQLTKKIKKSRGIDKDYKKLLINFVESWLELYPESDFSVLYYNLDTLKIEEIPQDQMMWAAISTTAIACYRPVDNTIYLAEGNQAFDRASDDFIVAMHESGHPSRTLKYYGSKDTITIGFYEDSKFGLYTDEALLTYFVYEIQGLNNKSTHYTLMSSYIRIMMDCLGDSYTGSDYMNHSVNYFVSKVDEYMGTDNAYKIIAMMEAEMSLHYTPYTSVDYEDFQEVFDYLVKMYMKKYLKAGMSKEEAEKVFDDFYEEITFNFENLTEPYPEITEDKFRPAFETCKKEFGI